MPPHSDRPKHPTRRQLLTWSVPFPPLQRSQRAASKPLRPGQRTRMR